MKLTSVNFSCWVTWSCRCCWLQKWGNQLVNHSPYSPASITYCIILLEYMNESELDMHVPNTCSMKYWWKLYLAESLFLLFPQEWWILIWWTGLEWKLIHKCVQLSMRWSFPILAVCEAIISTKEHGHQPLEKCWLVSVKQVRGKIATEWQCCGGGPLSAIHQKEFWQSAFCFCAEEVRWSVLSKCTKAAPWSSSVPACEGNQKWSRHFPNTMLTTFVLAESILAECILVVFLWSANPPNVILCQYFMLYIN